MKAFAHAAAGVLGFLLVSTFVVGTTYGLLAGDAEILARVKTWNLRGMFALVPALLIAGASGVSLLGKRTAPLALTKQKRGPIAFMTSLFVLFPSAWLLSRWASAEPVGALFYGVQALELAGSGLAWVMIGLNIRDGLALRGRIASTKTAGPVIERHDGGPLVAVGLPVLRNADGAALQTKSVMALCRCGQSSNKPFCDGTHALVGFDSTLSDDRTKDEVLVYEGTERTIHYNRMLCSHAAECGRRKKAAFDSKRKPWIVPDNATPDELAEIVEACPSGALRLSTPSGTPEHLLSEDVGITIEKNGPLRVLGVNLADPRLATGAAPTKYVLCRCGSSKNKPYCDGSHYDVGWRDA